MLISYEKEYRDGCVYCFEYEPDPEELKEVIVNLVYDNYFKKVIPTAMKEAFIEKLRLLLEEQESFEVYEEAYENEIAAHFEGEAWDLFINR